MRRAKITLISTPLGLKESTCATLGAVYKFQIHAQIWKFRKSALILKTAARREKISLISTLWGRKRVHIQLWHLSSNIRFHVQNMEMLKIGPYLENAARRA